MGDREVRVGHGACVVPDRVLLYVNYTKYLTFGLANCAVHLMRPLVSRGRFFPIQIRKKCIENNGRKG